MQAITIWIKQGYFSGIKLSTTSPRSPGDVFHWGELMAASVITTLPVVVLYMFIHRWMVEGLVAGSVKG